MNRSDIESIAIRYDSNFHQEIVKKYQTGKVGFFRFPRLTFLKNIGKFPHEKINLHLMFHLYINNRTIAPSFAVKILPTAKGMISWLYTKNDQQLSTKLKNVQHVYNDTNIFPATMKFPWSNQFAAELFQTFNNRNYTQSTTKLKNVQNFNNDTNIFPTEIKFPWSYQFTSVLHSIFNDRNDTQSVMTLKSVHNVNNETGIFPTASEISGINHFRSGLFPIRHIYENRTTTALRLRSLFFKADTLLNESNRFLNPLFLAIKTVCPQMATYLVSSEISMMNSQASQRSNYMQILNIRSPLVNNGFQSINCINNTMYSTIDAKKRISKYQFLFDRKSPSILSQSNFLFNHTVGVNRLFFEKPNFAAVNEPKGQNNYFSFRHDVSNFSPKSYAYNADVENLYLRDTKRIEQEIENIKKIAIETKESVLDKSKSSPGEADIKRYIDINRISDQVYQNIERTIRMERERRGM